MTLLKSDRIAISGEIAPSFLKHRLLFFDRIGVFELAGVYKLLRIDALCAEGDRLKAQLPRTKGKVLGGRKW